MAEVYHNQEPRLQAEVSILNLDDLGVDGVVLYVGQSDPEAALRRYRQANPDLDLGSLKKLQKQAEKDPYPLVVGVLKALAED